MSKLKVKETKVPEKLHLEMIEYYRTTLMANGFNGRDADFFAKLIANTSKSIAEFIIGLRP